MTVRYLLDQLIAAWRRDNHPFQTHVQYRGPLGGSALRGYQVSQADIHIPALPSPCLLCGRIAFPYLTRSGYDENVATTRLSWTASYREHTLRMTLRGFDTRGDETSHPTHHRCPCPSRRASGVVSFLFLPGWLNPLFGGFFASFCPPSPVGRPIGSCSRLTAQ